MKTKVVHLITLLELGGAQGNTLYTVRHLDKNRFDAVLWTGRGAYLDQSAQTDLGKEGKLKYFSRLVRPINPLFDFLIVFDLARALKKFKPMIVHTHSSKAGIVGRIAAKIAKIPVIVHTFHGFGFNDQQNFLIRNLFIWLEQITAKFSTALIFVSKSNMDIARRLQIGDSSCYHLIRSGVPTNDIRNRAAAADINKLRGELEIPVDAPVVTTIGPFKPQKNLPDFIRAAAQIHKEVPQAHFLVVGDGTLRGTLEQQIKAAGLTEFFHLPGWRSDIPEILATTTVFTLTSLWEGLPRALVEALLAGVPAVCYDTDGVRDLLGGRERVLVPQGDVRGLSSRITTLLQNETARVKSVAESKALIGNDFDIDEMIRQQEILYQTLLARL